MANVAEHARIVEARIHGYLIQVMATVVVIVDTSHTSNTQEAVYPPSYFIKGGIALENRLKELDAFEIGLKPAVLGVETEKNFAERLLKLKAEYPYLDKDIGMRDDVTSYLFFQSEEQRRRFLIYRQGVDRKTPEFALILGWTLGYPPRAVEAFYKKEKLKAAGDPLGMEMQQRTVSLYHAGLGVQSPIADAVENVRWLWNKYKYEEPLHIGVVDVDVWRNLAVRYMDYDDLYRVLGQASAMVHKLKPAAHA